MREVILDVNEKYKSILSKDLGALSGFLFDVGIWKIVVGGNWKSALKFDKNKLEKTLKKRHDQVKFEFKEENEHLKIQILLTEIGRSLGYNVFIALNDHCKSLDGKSLEFMTLSNLPQLDIPRDVLTTVSLIDVIWINKNTKEIDCAFEIEKSTSIYSGILRLLDLATSLGDKQYNFFLVAPDSREKELLAQLKRPSFKDLNHIKLKYILFSDLYDNCSGICKFGDNYKILFKIAK
ncbi:MAG: hypothetical protein LKE46_00600 [Clostridium sp.]|uniref:hypothetical protein n=1 Tax=Clostridium sp. TaxID=1506 RepID=UPI0025C6B870|nr:hypothetical protein [Clostridium sp.]MCH3962753.1 hypothetical protein [Clostridium sp.]MCI1715832.1 hypothetical protein [Clostridium sp.]MCI1799963.1 hypothetical protein [Clostridium sp.]MCI1813877.1 hypothetical protein [Clostridium sp.]MCI1870775.1 hypothetical protein [Clostridium sp.]